MTINIMNDKYDTKNCDYVLMLEQSHDNSIGRIQVITNDQKEIDTIIPEQYLTLFLQEFDSIKNYSQEFELPDINNPHNNATITRNIINSKYVDNYNKKQEIRSIVCKIYDTIS